MNAMIQDGASKAELGRRLTWHPAQIARVLDPDRESKLDVIEQALAAMNRRIDLQVFPHS